MDLLELERIKKLSVIAMVSDDYLMKNLVLKGGNAIDLIYKISDRASIDIDFSISNEFKKNELKTIEGKIKKNLEETFFTEGLIAFDVKFYEKPTTLNEKLKTFWGGYKIDFKVIPKDLYNKHFNDTDSLRRNATIVDLKQRKTFNIEISKYEFCTDKEAKEIDGYRVYAYTPEMIVFEKLRAICQQMPEYREIVKTNMRPRARDFYDIYLLMNKFSIDLNTDKNKKLISEIFKVKKVPLLFLKKLPNQKEFHRQDFSSVKSTVREIGKLKDFDFYFDFAVKQFSTMDF